MVVTTASGVKAQMQLGVRITDVTPEDASRWLANNKGNRSPRSRWIEKMARDMRSGKWTLSPDCIAFTDDGNLVNGQNRLMAIVKSGTAQSMLIVEGLPSHSISNIDTGMLRKFGDMLHFHRGETSGRAIAAVVAFAHVWRALDGNYHSAGWMTPTTEEALTSFDARAELFREAASRGANWAKGLGAAPSLCGGLFTVFHEIDPDDAVEFFDRASSGADLPGDSPLLLLRNQMLSAKATGRRHTKRHAAALIVKAWNYYRSGNHVGTLKWNGAIEKFPIPL